jgi:uncharacterized protein YkwD
MARFVLIGFVGALVASFASTAPAAGASAAVEAIAALNAVRRDGCGDASGVKVALRPDARLDAAAGAVACGRAPRDAIAQAGYRAVQSIVLEARGVAGRAQLARAIGRQFCAQATVADLRHAGAFRRSDDWWIVLAAPFAVPALDANKVGQRVLELVNQARAQPRRCGGRQYAAAAPLRWSAPLGRAAAAQARDLAARGVLSHSGRDGSTAGERVSRAGYAWRAVGENVAAGQRTAEEVVQSWLGSPGHCANVMNADFAEMGVAFATNAAAEAGIFWAQVFAAPDKRAAPARRAV